MSDLSVKIGTRVAHKRLKLKGKVARIEGNEFVVATDEPYCGRGGMLCDGFYARLQDLTVLLAVLFLAGCAVRVDPPRPESHGQQWDWCTLPEQGCFAGSGVSCFDDVCTFACDDRLKEQQCSGIGGVCSNGVCVELGK